MGKTLMLLRRITKHVKDQNWVAIVIDFFIVVVGVLLAFQITNWNEEWKDRRALSSYLTSMSKNIEFDLASLARLKVKRVNALNKIQFLDWTSLGARDLDLQTVRVGSETFTNLSDYESFSADQSAFETFKSSGLLSEIQGRDLEALIFRYYKLAAEIEVQEESYNDTLKTSFANISEDGLEGMVYVLYPGFIESEAQLDTLEPQIRSVLAHPSALSLFGEAFNNAPELIVRYENLELLGREIIKIVERSDQSLDLSSPEALDGYFELGGNEGYSKILLNGSIASSFFEMGYASADGAPVNVSQGISEMALALPEAEWSVFYFRNRSNAFAEKPVKDFSRFSSIKLTMRGSVGGEQIELSLKDATDPDDGSESKYAITLTSEWKSYEIPLELFETADLAELFVPLNIIVSGESKTVLLRDIEFVP